MVDAAERTRVQRRCTQFFGHPPQNVRARLRALADAAEEQDHPDRYGGGELIERFESEIATLLGKEAAVFMPSGTMAQQTALRVHAERSRNTRVALHPQSHLVASEEDAYQRLHGLHGVLVGERNRLFTLGDLQALRERVGTLLVELPERNIGGVLRPWDELGAIAAWARESGVALHLDGARIWESQPFYDRSLAQIAALFDTVYVSFYKVLDAVAGAALAGPKALIDEARLWQWRHGGRLVQQYPLIVSARAGIRTFLPKVPHYVARARELAALFAAFPGVDVTPNPPHTNMMHVYVRGDIDRLDEAAVRVASETGFWIVGMWRPTAVPSVQSFEIHCAEGALVMPDGELRSAFERLLTYAR